MEIKILQVFLGADGLPYKDQARTVHYPIAGSGFQGANNSTQIKFYFSELGDSNVTWVAVSKLPNGKIGSKVLQTYDDADLGEPYALLELDSFYTQYRGDVYISLQGYEGGVNVSYNAETELYEISGTPTIQATGSIKFSNNYATQFVGSGEEENADIQALMAALGLKANASDTYTRYTSAFSSVTLQTLYNQFGYKAFLLNTGSTYSIDYLMQFQISSGNTYAIRMIRLTDLRTWYAQIGSGSGQLPLSSYVSALFTDTYLKHITTEEYVAQYYVPYTGATTDVDLGTHTIKANQFEIGSSYYQIGLVGSDLVIGTGTGNIYLQPSVKLYYGSYEIATVNQLDTKVDKTSTGTRVYATDDSGNPTTIEYDSFVDGQIVRRVDSISGNIYVGTPTAMNHATPKSYVDNKVSALGTVLNYKGTKTVAELNALTGQVAGDVYNVTDAGTLSAGSVEVLAGDNIVWTSNSVWDKLAGTVDLSGYVLKTQTIAGLALSGNISASALTDALDYANNTDIDNLF